MEGQANVNDEDIVENQIDKSQNAESSDDSYNSGRNQSKDDFLKSIDEKLNQLNQRQQKQQEEKDQKTPAQRNSEKPSKNNQVVCTSSNPDKKSSVVPIPPTAEKDIVPVLAPQNAREEQTQGQPVPKIIRVPPSGPSPVDQVKPIEKSASKVKATKTFMPPVGFTPPFSQVILYFAIFL